MSKHLDYERHDPAGRGSGNSRISTKGKQVLTEIGDIDSTLPCDSGRLSARRLCEGAERAWTGSTTTLSPCMCGLTTGSAVVKPRSATLECMAEMRA